VNVSSGGSINYYNAILNGNGTLSYQGTSDLLVQSVEVLNHFTLNIGTTISGSTLYSSDTSGFFSIDGTSTVNIGSATTTGALIVDNPNMEILGVLQVNSGSTIQVNGIFDVQFGGRATLNLDGGNFNSPSAIIAGTNSKWELVDGTGLVVDNGAQVQVGSNIRSTGGLLSVAGDLSVEGEFFSSTLTIDNGGTVTANALFIDPAVVNGYPAGTLNFNNGTLGITGAAGLTLGPTTLGTNFSITPVRTVNVSNTTTVPVGSSLSLDGGTLNTGGLVVNGAFAFHDGTLGITGPAGLTIGAGGPLGATLLMDASRALHVTNTLTVNSGAYLAVAGGLSAGKYLNNGDFVVINTAVDGPVVNNHAVTVVGNVDFNGLVSGPGGFFGPGTAHFNGGLAPGASPANVSFEGSLALADTNTLFIEIGGNTPGSQYYRLTIAGSATLDGALNLSLINGFTPSGGQQFTILTAGSIVDNGFVLTGSAARLFNLVVSGTSVMLQAIGLPGDYNGNGIVDAADYAVWRDHLGQSVTLPNDTTPGSVTQADYDVWKSNFGNHSGSGSGASAAVPEPASLLLLLSGTLAIPRICQKGRKLINA
jgi:hypothetical protein